MYIIEVKLSKRIEHIIDTATIIFYSVTRVRSEIDLKIRFER